jgi:hypothetical protein
VRYLKDPKTKKESVSLTFFVLGFLVATLKLLLSGLVIRYIQFGVFGGGDFAAVVGALGALYAARKHTDAHTRKNSKDEENEN